MSVRSAALWMIGGQYLGFVIQFVTSVLVSRFFLSPAEVGLFSIAVAATQIAAAFQEFGLTRYIAGQEKLDQKVLKTCGSVAIFLAWGVALVIAASSVPVAAFYGDGRLVPLLLMLAASYLFVPFSVVSVAALSHEMNFKSILIASVGSTLANAVVAIGLAALGYSAASLAWGLLAQSVSRAVLVQWLRPVPWPFPLQLKGTLPVIKFGSAASVLYISAAVGSRAPDLVVGRLISLQVVGLFSRATGLAAQLVILLTGALGSVFFPAFARIRDRGEPFAPAYYRVVGSFTAIVWPAMAGMAVGAEPLVRAIYGERWIDSAPLLTSIALSEIFFVMLPLHTDLPIVMGKMSALIRRNLMETGLAIAILAIACGYGVQTAAESRIAFGAVWFAIYARFLRNIVDFAWREMVRLYLLSGVATLAAVAPLLLCYRFWVPAAEMSFPLLFAGSVAGVAAWLVVMAITRHPALDEIRAIAEPFLARLRPSTGDANGQGVK